MTRHAPLLSGIALHIPLASLVVDTAQDVGGRCAVDNDNDDGGDGGGRESDDDERTVTATLHSPPCMRPAYL